MRLPLPPTYSSVILQSKMYLLFIIIIIIIKVIINF